MMQILWTIAGAFIGWILIEIFGVFARVRIPLSFNLMVSFVGALIGYTLTA